MFRKSNCIFVTKSQKIEKYTILSLTINVLFHIIYIRFYNKTKSLKKLKSRIYIYLEQKIHILEVTQIVLNLIVTKMLVGCYISPKVAIT